MRRLSDDPNEVDWEDFYNTYRLTILAYAQRKGLAPNEADDVLQETMMSLMKAFRKDFVYDRNKGSFRGFLRVVTRWRIADAYKRKARQPLLIENVEDFVPQDESEPVEDRDWQIALIAQALQNFRETSRFDEVNLRAFETYALKGFSAKETEEMHGMKANNVHQIYHRICNALRDEVASLEGPICE